MDNIKLPAVLILMVLFAFNINADEYNGKQIGDSIRLDEVVVTGTVSGINLNKVPMSVTIVGQQQIRNRFESSLLPILTEEVPSLFITQRGVMGYGVSGGSAGGMSMRGVGGSPTSGVLILIDGHPQYMGLMGHPIADSYQSVMTDHAEVIRGPASVLYGSNAMGGVINIITNKQKDNGLREASQIMYGSYNTLSIDYSLQYRQNKFYGIANLGYNKSDGHRDNMDFWQGNIYSKVGYDFNNKWTAFIDLNLSKTLSSNPGMETAPLKDNDADILRGVSSIAIENKYEKTSGVVRLFYNFGAHHINDGYKAEETPLDYRFNSNDQMMGIAINQSYELFDGNKTSIGIDYNRFGGNAWNKFVVNSSDIEITDIHLFNVAGYTNIQQSFYDNKLTFNTGIRLDYHEKNGYEFIPQIGVSFIPTTSTSFKAIVSKGFRNPTIREMYMFPPQNPNLRPEKVMNYEVSMTHSLLNDKLSVGLNLFFIEGKNIIQTIMTEGRPLNINLGKIENKGFEISSKYNVNNNLTINSNYSYLHMKYKVIAAPKHKLYVTGNYHMSRWNLGTGLQLVSDLYTSLYPDFSKETYLLWNTRISYRFNRNIDMFIKGENLLSARYEINKGFPMPIVSIFGGLRLSM